MTQAQLDRIELLKTELAFIVSTMDDKEDVKALGAELTSIKSARVKELTKVARQSVTAQKQAVRVEADALGREIVAEAIEGQGIRFLLTGSEMEGYYVKSSDKRVTVQFIDDDGSSVKRAIQFDKILGLISL